MDELMSSDLIFNHRGCHFVCVSVELNKTLFQPYVVYQSGIFGSEKIFLPQDTEPYASEAEALRHAQQQAARWVYDRTGDVQERF